MTETRAHRRMHVELCYEIDADEVSEERYIEILERILPGGALVTVRAHTGLCVAGDPSFART